MPTQGSKPNVARIASNAALPLFALFALQVGISSVGEAQQEPFALTIQTAATAEASAHGSPGQTQQDSASALASALGNEASTCGYGEERKSVGRASASVRRDAVTAGSAAFLLSSRAYANGGHRITSTPVCIGKFGEDSAGSAKASSGAELVLRFEDQARPIRYTAEISTNATLQGAIAAVRVTDAENRALFQSSGGGGRFDFESAPGKLLRISVSLDASAQDRGGGLSAEQSGSMSVAVSIARAALGASADERRLIGRDTTAYPAVGALLKNGEMHCTGTLIAPDLVLTAGHCVYLYERREISFKPGHNIYLPGDVVTAERLVWPTESGFRYNDASLENDIGLVYLSHRLPIAPARLHAGRPNLQTAFLTRTPLSFVGFGFTIADGQPAASGIKRLADIPIHELTSLTFSYVGTANTCKGDSGGPAFLVGGNQLFLAGITSKGDPRCVVSGVDTRVEKYFSWIQGHLPRGNKH